MKKIITGGIVLDGTLDMTPVKDLVLVIQDDKIEKILSTQKWQEVKNEQLKQGEYEEIDLKGQYIMPGLINMHVHLPGSGKPKKKQPNMKFLIKLITCCDGAKKEGYKMCHGYAMTELKSGVTTLRTVGGIADFDSVVRDQINAGEVDGPRILAANMAVSVPGGHMAGTFAYEAKSVQEAEELVRKIAKEKPDLIKLMITGGVMDAKVKGEPGILRMPEEYVKAACKVAHSLGFQVAAHVESPEGVKVALRSGVDTIEHGAAPDDEMIALFKEHGACLISTISPALPYALFDLKVSHATELSKFNGNVVLQGSIECAKKCLENGIRVGLGTDTGCPFITQYDTWRELCYMQKYCSVTASFALHTATQVNAQIAGIGDQTGTIEEGKSADLIVTKDNPLENLQALRHVEIVIARGKVFANPQVTKMQGVEDILDKYL